MELRKSIFSIFFFSTIAIFPLENYSQTEKANQFVIVVDPGHGGSDPGAVGINGNLEKEVVLKIAQEMIRISKLSLEDEFKIYLTRYKDSLISLGDRAKLAKGLKADVFISLHCNHSDNPDAQGLEVYVSNIKSQQSKESILLAYRIQKEISKELGFKSRGVKFANFKVLRESIAYHPAVLIELGFLSNWEEEIWLSNPENLNYLASLILVAIRKSLDL
ncbi:N-acetylmuramoyl-L-alanine amidase family protein [Gillisia hiemivivida]|uniref:N-acetylmuramoyl-L-alanine amidase n=1 Tax=Gillisia hiemivivida TaxID=291190 RepID=A0A5C7A249_9FLAO|nr:N-acetylmuramoyl-L-alanine amidase [Gillisia hiemivivida]TXD95039.1 N-acetylmuramoyl-L-alanine amidase [Gillisia hiemivivida]